MCACRMLCQLIGSRCLLLAFCPCSLVYHPMQQGVEGFRAQDFLYADKIHPSDRGHSYVAQLVARFLQRSLEAEQQRQLAEAWRAHWERQRAAAGAAGSYGGGASVAGMLSSLQPPEDAAADAQAAAGAAAGSAALAAAEAARAASPAGVAGGVPGAAQLHTPFATADPGALPPPMLAGAEPLTAESCLRERPFMLSVDATKSSGFRQVRSHRGSPSSRVDQSGASFGNACLWGAVDRCPNAQPAGLGRVPTQPAGLVRQCHALVSDRKERSLPFPRRCRWEDKGLPGRPEVRAITDKVDARLTIRINTGGWHGCALRVAAQAVPAARVRNAAQIPPVC